MPVKKSEYLEEEQCMKKRKIIFLIVICIIAIMLFRACSDDKHITQKEAEKIAKALAGNETTFVKSEIKNDGKVIDYVFTDTRETTFTITSCLFEPNIDGAIAEGFPLERDITTDYDYAIVKCNEDKIREILERHGLNDWLGNSFKGFGGIDLEGYVGTPEENQEILNKFIAAGVEIDALLSMTMDRTYFESLEFPFFISVPNMTIRFNKKLEGKDIDEICVDIINVNFSTSSDTRWTFDSLYEEAKKDIDSIELVD